MKKLLLTIALVSGLVGLAPPALQTAAQAQTHPPAAAPLPPDLPPFEPAAGDLAQWRRLVLPNGMKVLLLSDPKLNVSSVALAVGVGSLADPPQRQGLAHFLEHMLFLGTEKYPDITGFDAYLRRNSGSHNAYTAEDRTNYFLDIRHEAFEGALDRFSQFFVAPLFDARFTEREVNAVASEHEKNLENDAWREQQVRMQAYAAGAPGAPLRHRQPPDPGRRDARRAARLLPPALQRQPHGAGVDGQRLARPARTLGAPVLRGRARPRAAGARLPARVPAPRRAALRLLRIEPVKDLRQLHLEFPLPGQHAGWPHKSAEALSYVLGGEGPGSLLAQLKTEGLATSLAAGAQSATRSYGAFELQIGLTPQGQAQVPRVLQLVFAAVALLREQGLPPHLFAERRALARLDERFRDRGEGAHLAAGLASAVLDHPLEVAERVPYLWLREDPQALRALLDRLVPDNLLVTLVAKGVPTDRVEPIYGTRYSYSEDGGDAWRALLQPPRVAGLALPAPNPFVPRRTEQRALQPARLIDEPALSLYHAQDVEFQRPQAAWLLRHRLPRALATPQTAALLRLYEVCVREALNETTYVAAEAGQRFFLSASFDGVTLATEGWDDASGRLLDAVTPALRDVPLAPERFAALKERLTRELESFDSADAYVSVRETRRAWVREFHVLPQQLLPLLQPLSLADVRAFAQRLFARGKLEALAFGNLPPDEAVAALRRVAAQLRTQPLPEAELLRPRLLVMQPGEELRTREALQVNNSVMRRELVLGDDAPAARAAALLLSAAIGDPFYSELRTRQQLGYIVQANAFEDERQTVALFLLQSGEYGADVLQARADAFIATLPALVAGLPAEAWSSIVAGVRARLLERDKSIAERAQRLFSLAYDRPADWTRREATLAALDTLTQARVATVLAQAIDPATRRQRSFLGYARQHEGRPGASPDEAERAAWKRGRRYE